MNVSVCLCVCVSVPFLPSVFVVDVSTVCTLFRLSVQCNEGMKAATEVIIHIQNP